MLRRWDEFARFLEDGRICLTDNCAQRALRGIALGRRSLTFAASRRGADRAAIMLTMITTVRSQGSATSLEGDRNIWAMRGSVQVHDLFQEIGLYLCLTIGPMGGVPDNVSTHTNRFRFVNASGSSAFGKLTRVQ